jgi:integrase
MGRHGAGTEFFDKDRDRWVVMRTIDGKRYKRTGVTVTEARLKMKELERALATGTTPTAARGGVTVGELLAEFVADVRMSGRAPSTIERHRWAAGRLADALGDEKADRLTPVKVERALRSFDDLSRASLVKVTQTGRQAFKAGIRRGRVKTNPFVGVELRRRDDARPRRSLTPVEARRLLAVLDGERFGFGFALSLLCGLRPGEAFAVTFGALRSGTVTVSRGVQRDRRGRARLVDDLKTSSARRTITLPPGLAVWADRLAAGHVGASGVLVCAVDGGAPVPGHQQRTALARACDRAGVPRVTPNELRHSCASLLADEGVPHESIAALLGHTSTRMVEATYLHRLRPTIDVAARASWSGPSNG